MRRHGSPRHGDTGEGSEPCRTSICISGSAITRRTRSAAPATVSPVSRRMFTEARAVVASTFSPGAPDSSVATAVVRTIALVSAPRRGSTAASTGPVRPR